MLEFLIRIEKRTVVEAVAAAALRRPRQNLVVRLCHDDEVMIMIWERGCAVSCATLWRSLCRCRQWPFTPFAAPSLAVAWRKREDDAARVMSRTVPLSGHVQRLKLSRIGGRTAKPEIVRVCVRRQNSRFERHLHLDNTTATQHRHDARQQTHLRM